MNARESFDDFIRELESDAEQEGPRAVAELVRLRELFATVVEEMPGQAEGSP